MANYEYHIGGKSITEEMIGELIAIGVPTYPDIMGLHNEWPPYTRINQPGFGQGASLEYKVRDSELLKILAVDARGIIVGSVDNPELWFGYLSEYTEL